MAEKTLKGFIDAVNEIPPKSHLTVQLSQVLYAGKKSRVLTRQLPAKQCCSNAKQLGEGRMASNSECGTWPQNGMTQDVTDSTGDEEQAMEVMVDEPINQESSDDGAGIPEQAKTQLLQEECDKLKEWVKKLQQEKIVSENALHEKLFQLKECDMIIKENKKKLSDQLSQIKRKEEEIKMAEEKIKWGEEEIKRGEESIIQTEQRAAWQTEQKQQECEQYVAEIEQDANKKIDKAKKAEKRAVQELQAKVEEHKHEIEYYRQENEKLNQQILYTVNAMKKEKDRKKTKRLQKSWCDRCWCNII